MASDFKDIATLGVQGKPQTGRIGLNELMEQGIYQVKRTPGDKFSFIAGKAYRADPDKNPLKTTSAKLEIHCKALSTKIAASRIVAMSFCEPRS